MKKIDFKQDTSSVVFSVLLFLNALLPIFEINNIIFYTLSSLMILCVLMGIVHCAKAIVKDKRSFVLNLTSRSVFSFFDAIIALIGLIIAYSFHTNMLNFWIFILVCSIAFILMPSPKIKSDVIQKKVGDK